MVGFLMKGYSSREPIGFAMAVLGSTRRPTTVNRLDVSDLQRIMTPSFVPFDIFSLVVPYLFAVWFVTRIISYVIFPK